MPEAINISLYTERGSSHCVDAKEHISPYAHGRRQGTDCGWCHVNFSCELIYLIFESWDAFGLHGVSVHMKYQGTGLGLKRTWI